MVGLMMSNVYLTSTLSSSDPKTTAVPCLPCPDPSAQQRLGKNFYFDFVHHQPEAKRTIFEGKQKNKNYRVFSYNRQTRSPSYKHICV